MLGRRHTEHHQAVIVLVRRQVEILREALDIGKTNAVSVLWKEKHARQSPQSLQHRSLRTEYTYHVCRKVHQAGDGDDDEI